MTFTGWSFWSRHRHITRVPTSRGSATAPVPALPFLPASESPPFAVGPPPLYAGAADPPFASARGGSIDPIAEDDRATAMDGGYVALNGVLRDFLALNRSAVCHQIGFKDAMFIRGTTLLVCKVERKQ